MDAIPFSPVWITSAGLIGTTGEVGSGLPPLNVELATEVRATVSVTLGQTYIIVGTTAASQIQEVRFGTMSLMIEATADGVLFPPMPRAGAVDIVLDRPVAYSRIAGTFPPGIGITTDGVISGEVDQVPPNSSSLSGTTNYEVVIRALSGGIARDRTFEISVEWTDSPPRWSDEYPEDDFFIVAPPGRVDVPRGSPFSYAFDVEDDDSLATSATLVGGTLPSGLRYDADRRRIDGVVALSAPLGTYLFTLSVGGVTREFAIVIVERDPNEPLAPPLSISWITPSGSLGTVRDNDPCAFGVRAEPTSEAEIVYSLVNGAGVLPPGLRIDESTGDITGTVTGGSGVYSFAIRARLGGAFEDRVFSITVTEFYNASSLVTLWLRAPGPLGDEILAEYGNVLEGREIFRPSDPLFGLPVNADIYLLGGMSADDSALLSATGEDAGFGIPHGSFHQWFEVRLERHGLIFVRQDGRVLYEVLARGITDPVSGAGGFNADGTPNPVPYPPDPGIEVRTPSIGNLRRDLARDLGFATINPALRNALGPNGGETMPLWLRWLSEYFAVMPVAFLMPGQGTLALEQARAAEGVSLPPNGTIVRFGGYATRRVLRPSGTVQDGFIPLERPRAGRPR